MKIKDHTYYNAYSDFIFHILNDGSKIYTLYVRNPSIRSTVSNSNLHLKNKNTVTRLFRVYSNLYTILASHNSAMTYNII